MKYSRVKEHVFERFSLMPNGGSLNRPLIVNLSGQKDDDNFHQPQGGRL